MSLNLSDTRVYEPQIRARLGTTAHFCRGVECFDTSQVTRLQHEVRTAEEVSNRLRAEMRAREVSVCQSVWRV